MIEKFESITGSVDLSRLWPAKSGFVRGRTFSTGIQLTNAVDANGDVIEDSTKFTMLSQVDTGMQRKEVRIISILSILLVVLTISPYYYYISSRGATKIIDLSN